MTDKAHHVDFDQFPFRLEAEQQMGRWCTMAPIPCHQRSRSHVGRPPGLTRGASHAVEAEKYMILMKFMRTCSDRTVPGDDRHDPSRHASANTVQSEEPEISQKGSPTSQRPLRRPRR